MIGHNIVTSPPWAVIAALAIALGVVVYVGVTGWDDALEWWARRRLDRNTYAVSAPPTHVLLIDGRDVDDNGTDDESIFDWRNYE